MHSLPLPTAGEDSRKESASRLSELLYTLHSLCFISVKTNGIINPCKPTDVHSVDNKPWWDGGCGKFGGRRISA